MKVSLLDGVGWMMMLFSLSSITDILLVFVLEILLLTMFCCNKVFLKFFLLNPYFPISLVINSFSSQRVFQKDRFFDRFCRGLGCWRVSIEFATKSPNNIRIFFSFAFVLSFVVSAIKQILLIIMYKKYKSNIDYDLIFPGKIMFRNNF